MQPTTPQPPQSPPTQQPPQAKPEIIINQPEKNSSLNFNKKNVFLSLAVFVLVSGVGIGTYLVNQRTNLLPQAKEITPTPASSAASSAGPRANVPVNQAPANLPPPRVQNTPAGTPPAGTPGPQSASPSAAVSSQKGDGNKDGKIDSADLEIANSLRNQPATSNPQLDMNDDGIINSFDISTLGRLVSNK